MCPADNSSLQELVSPILERSPLWFHLGLVFGLSYGRLRVIQMDTPTTEQRLIKTVSSWLCLRDRVLVCGRPCWRTLVRALAHPLVREMRLAGEIADRHKLSEVCNHCNCVHSVNYHSNDLPYYTGTHWSITGSPSPWLNSIPPPSLWFPCQVNMMDTSHVPISHIQHTNARFSCPLLTLYPPTVCVCISSSAQTLHNDAMHRNIVVYHSAPFSINQCSSPEYLYNFTTSFIKHTKVDKINVSVFNSIGMWLDQRSEITESQSTSVDTTNASPSHLFITIEYGEHVHSHCRIEIHVPSHGICHRGNLQPMCHSVECEKIK